jgi:arylsulfatase A-like enzyme
MVSAKNIVVVFNDDHGQWALGAYGNKELRTPTLDYLAAAGVLMNNAFTPTPVCSPARACFLTGRLASQHGLHDYLLDARPEFHERWWLKDEVTLPEILQRVGYDAALCGKWHLGNDVVPQAGFSSWFALSGDYPIGARGAHRYSLDGDVRSIKGYKSQVIADHAIRFLRNRRQDKPFLLFVGFTATHSPWADHPERLVESYRTCAFAAIPPYPAYPFGRQNLESVEHIDRTRSREALAQYYAAVSTLDEATGRIMDELDALDLVDETLIVYTSDHGLCCGHHGIWGKGNGTLPLNMVEESIRIPMILYHRGSLLPGQRRVEFVDHLDLFRTLVEFAGAEHCLEPARNYPGRSFLPLLANQALDPPWRSAQFCEYGNVRMIRTHRYKLVKRLAGDPDQLFDLWEDPAEIRNAIEEPSTREVVEELGRRLAEHFQRYEIPGNSGARSGGPEPTNWTSPWAPNLAR